MLTPETILHRVPDLVVEIDTSNQVRLRHEGRVLRFGPEALSVLDVVHEPTSVADTLRRLSDRLAGRRAAALVLRAITMLVNTGVLRTDPVRCFSELPFPMGGYDAAFVHLTILNDTVRKGAFVRAVRQVVQPDDVVLDLGTGSGILAVAAAQAGARHVYAMEPAGMVHLAETVAEHNGVADRITFMRGWSAQIGLPEPATVLTTDLVGNEALDMVVWETVHDVRERLLTDDARLVPSSIDGFASLVDVPAEVIARHRVDVDQVSRWERAYGIDFAPLLDADACRPVGFYERPEVVQKWTVLGAPTPLYRVDLTSPVSRLDRKCTLSADRTGIATGIVIFYEAHLAPGITFSSAPWRGCERSHWYTAVWALPQPVPVDAGASLEIRWRYEGEGRSRLDRVSPATSCQVSKGMKS